MPLTAIFTQRRPNIGGFTFDATLEESTDLVSDVTRYPIENGDIANDFVNTRNVRISMLVGVSDNFYRSLAANASTTNVGDALADLGFNAETVSQIVGIGSSVATGVVANALGGTGAAISGIGASIGNAAYAAGQAATRSENALASIRNLQRSKTPFLLVTSKATYQNVVITRTQQTTNTQNEQGLELLVEMEALRIFNSTLVQNQGVLPPNDSASVQASPYVPYGEITASPLP